MFERRLLWDSPNRAVRVLLNVLRCGCHPAPTVSYNPRELWRWSLQVQARHPCVALPADSPGTGLARYPS